MCNTHNKYLLYQGKDILMRDVIKKPFSFISHFKSWPNFSYQESNSKPHHQLNYDSKASRWDSCDEVECVLNSGSLWVTHKYSTSPSLDPNHHPSTFNLLGDFEIMIICAWVTFKIKHRGIVLFWVAESCCVFYNQFISSNSYFLQTKTINQFIIYNYILWCWFDASRDW